MRTLIIGLPLTLVRSTATECLPSRSRLTSWPASTREVMICTQYTSVLRVRGGGLTADVGVVLSVAAAIGGGPVVVAVGMATRISGAGAATSTMATVPAGRDIAP